MIILDSMLSGSMVASSFGKLVMKQNPREGVKEEDLALALLMMITNNIGQVAHLNAQLHSCSKIFFVGSFLRHNPISCRRLAFAIDFWSGGEMEALFLVHEGYFGALGTFLQSALGDDVDKIIAADSLMKKMDSNPIEANLKKPFTKRYINKLIPGLSLFEKRKSYDDDLIESSENTPRYTGRARCASDDFVIRSSKNE